MILRLLIVAVLLVLAPPTGCMLRPFSSSWSVYHSREKEAVEVYHSGSTIGGGAESLLLFEDGTFESWGMSCTEAHRGSTGHYTKKGNRVTLSSPDSIETLTLFRFRGKTFLVTPSEMEDIRKISGPDYLFTRSLKKWTGDSASEGK